MGTVFSQGIYALAKGGQGKINGFSFFEQVTFSTLTRDDNVSVKESTFAAVGFMEEKMNADEKNGK